jgi:hypothetical protein
LPYAALINELALLSDDTQRLRDDWADPPG